MRRGSGIGALGANASNDDESEKHHAVGDEQIHASGHLVTGDNRRSHGKDLKNIGDELDKERILDANGLGKNNAVDVEEENAADLGAHHGTARVEELTTLDGIGKKAPPGGFLGVLLLHPAGLLKSLNVLGGVVLGLVLVDLAEGGFGLLCATLEDVPERAFGDEGETGEHHQGEDDETTHGDLVG